jgi:hypothetical protein
MTTTERVKQYLLDNPHYKNAGEVAKACDTTPGFVTTAIYRLRQKSQIPPSGNRKADFHKGLEEECDAVGIPINSVGHYWYKGKHYSIHAKANELSYLQAIEDIVNELPKRKLKSIAKDKKKRCIAIKATLADMHVGMEPNPDGKALFGYRYDEVIFNEHLERVYHSLLKEFKLHGKFDVLVLDDLGDGLDGWDGFTTRGGHALPQNMDNVKAFKTYVFGKLDLIERVYEAGIASKIYVRNVTQCNHCFTEDTEVLTNNGWKTYLQLDKTDKIATLNLGNNGVEFQQPLDYIMNDFEGVVHSYKNKNTDLLVTDEHRILHRRDLYNKSKKDYGYSLSKDVTKGGQIYFKVSGNNYKADYPISDELIRFTAWVLTDGTLAKYNGDAKGYVIYQSKQRGIDIIKSLLDKMRVGYRMSVVDRKVKEVCGRELVKEALPQTVFSVNKSSAGIEKIKELLKVIDSKDCFPEWLWELSKRQFDIFLKEYIEGDGNYKDTSATIHGTKMALDSLQSLCVVNNTKANLSQNNRGHYVLCVVFDKNEVCIHPDTQFSERQYKGFTWCLTMPNSNLFVRRNGKVTVQGNSGNFGHTANIAIQMLIERQYEKSAIEYIVIERFMEHFSYGDHTFILTHGKDPKYMKRGLPYKLTAEAENFINDYIEHYGIDSKYIHLEKGDLHQIGFEKTNRFDYRNFMSFAPPSAYGQHNYGDGYGGFSIQVVPKHSSEISHTDYFFEFKKSTVKNP